MAVSCSSSPAMSKSDSAVTHPVPMGAEGFIALGGSTAVISLTR